MKYTFSRDLLGSMNKSVRIRLSLTHALSQVLLICFVQKQLLERIRAKCLWFVVSFYHCIVHEEGRVNNWI